MEDIVDYRTEPTDQEIFEEKLDELIYLMNTDIVIKDFNNKQESDRLYEYRDMLEQHISENIMFNSNYYIQMDLKTKLNELFKDYKKIFDIVNKHYTLSDKNKERYNNFSERTNALLTKDMTYYDFIYMSYNLLNDIIEHLENLED